MRQVIPAAATVTRHDRIAAGAKTVRTSGTYLGQIVLGGQVHHERRTLDGAVQHLDDGDGGQQEQAGGLHDARARYGRRVKRTGRRGARKNARRLKRLRQRKRQYARTLMRRRRRQVDYWARGARSRRAPG